MKTKHFLAAAACFYIFFLLAYIPTSEAIPILEKALPQLKIQGPAGTLWNGSAQRIIYSSKHRLDDAHWSICTWRLIIGEVCAGINAKYDNNDLRSEIGINVAGTLKIRDLAIIIDAEPLGDQLNLPIGKLSGNISLNIEHMELTNNSIPATTGTIKWSDATVTFSEKVQLGSIVIQITESDEYPLTATFSNNGGHLAISGRTDISDDATYNLELKLQPESNASTNLHKTLGMFTKKQTDGSYIVRNNGNLKESGIL